MRIKEGDIIVENLPVYKIFITKEIVKYNLPEEIFTKPIYGKMIPVISEISNDVIVVLTVAYSLREQYEIEESTNSLNSSLRQTVDTIEEFAGS